MKNKTMKISVALITLMLIISIATLTLGVPPAGVDDKNIKTVGNADLITAINRIITVFKWIGTVAGIVILMMLGIKYMAAAPSEKADIKKGAMIYLVGAAVLFIAPWIVDMIYKFAIKL